MNSCFYAIPANVHVCAYLPMKNSDFREMYELYRKQIEHEDILVNQRITFSTVVQTALVTLFALSENFISDEILLVSFRKSACVLGIGMVVYAFVGVLTAIAASNRLGKRCSDVIAAWKQSMSCDHALHNLLPKRGSGGGSRCIHMFGSIFGPWTFLSFGLFWVYVLFFIL